MTTAQTPAFELAPGTVSFSAGSSDIGDMKFRYLPDADNRVRQAGGLLFPDRPDLFEGAVVVSTYPASLGRFDDMVFVDSYLRPATFFKGLELARQAGRTVVCIGQPLVLADRLYSYTMNGGRHGGAVVIGVGGYYCPQSLENFLVRGVKSAGASAVHTVHAYGAAEIEFACLVGVRRPGSDRIHYRVAVPGISVERRDGRLVLHKSTTDGPITAVTEDDVELTDQGIFITPGLARLAADVRTTLESADDVFWRRRTGYVARDGDRLVWQLRIEEVPEFNDDMEHYDFCRQTGMGWAEKPNWSV